jgi:glycosyltransferase involved in cell wall biosynthesis
MRRLRVHLMPEVSSDGTEWSCAAIRLLLPYRHKWMRQRIELSISSRPPSESVDLIVLQRGGPPGFTLYDAAELLRSARRRGIRVIYDLDDDLLSEHPVGEVEAGLAPHRTRIRLLLSGADAVIVSTSSLRERVKSSSDRVWVWQNAIDDHLVVDLEPSDAHHDAITVGYFGSYTHLPDLLWIRESFEEGLTSIRVPVTFEFCGISLHPAISTLFRGADIRIKLPEGDYASFMLGMQQGLGWDIGLAPLAPGTFNRSKSDIKFLDYALFGVPAIVSDCESYGTASDGITAKKAGRHDWGSALQQLAEDPGLRERIRQNARAYLLEERVLSRRLPDLWDIIQQAI